LAVVVAEQRVLDRGSGQVDLVVVPAQDHLQDQELLGKDMLVAQVGEPLLPTVEVAVGVQAVPEVMLLIALQLVTVE
jgi:hypothetical protein